MMVLIMRGLPGSGKSTYANTYAKANTAAHPDNVLFASVQIVSADHYMLNERGEYEFNPKWLIACHAQCQVAFVGAVRKKTELVIVDNTNVTFGEFLFYKEVGKMFGYEVQVYNLFDGGCTDQKLAERNTHRVPLEAIQAMRARWEK